MFIWGACLKGLLAIGRGCKRCGSCALSSHGLHGSDRATELPLLHNMLPSGEPEACREASEIPILQCPYLSMVFLLLRGLYGPIPLNDLPPTVRPASQHEIKVHVECSCSACPGMTKLISHGTAWLPATLCPAVRAPKCVNITALSM